MHLVPTFHGDSDKIILSFRLLFPLLKSTSNVLLKSYVRKNTGLLLLDPSKLRL